MTLVGTLESLSLTSFGVKNRMDMKLFTSARHSTGAVIGIFCAAATTTRTKPGRRSFVSAAPG